MITPAPCSSIAGKSARSNRTADNKLRSSARYHSLSSSTAKPPAGADDTADDMDEDVETAKAITNCVGHDGAAVGRGKIRGEEQIGVGEFGRWVFRAVVRTFAPAFRNLATTASPIPSVPPVTSVVRAIQLEIVVH